MDPGTWTNAIAGFTALAAAAALWFAHRSAQAARGQLNQVTQDARDRQRREEAEQARRVFWREDPLVYPVKEGTYIWGQQVQVVNNSEEPLVAVLAVGWDRLDFEGSSWWASPVGVLGPHQDHLVAEIIYTDAPHGVREFEPVVERRQCLSASIWRIAVTFKDTMGTWWIRYPDMTLDRLDGLAGWSPGDDVTHLKAVLREWNATNP